jgi:hypothetical protein
MKRYRVATLALLSELRSEVATMEMPRGRLRAAGAKSTGTGAVWRPRSPRHPSTGFRTIAARSLPRRARLRAGTTVRPRYGLRQSNVRRIRRVQ